MNSLTVSGFRSFLAARSRDGEWTDAQLDRALRQVAARRKPDAANGELATKAFDAELCKGFTGVVTGKNGAHYHYVDGKRVAGHEYESHTEHGNPNMQSAVPEEHEANSAQAKKLAESMATSSEKLDHSDLNHLHSALSQMSVPDLRELAKKVGKNLISPTKTVMVNGIMSKIASDAGSSVQHPVSAAVHAVHGKLADMKQLTAADVQALPDQLAKLNIQEVWDLKKKLGLAGKSKQAAAPLLEAIKKHVADKAGIPYTAPVVAAEPEAKPQEEAKPVAEPKPGDVLHTFPNAADGTEAVVKKVSNGYSVSLKDTDANETLSALAIFPDEAAAIAKAKKLANVQEAKPTEPTYDLVADAAKKLGINLDLMPNSVNLKEGDQQKLFAIRDAINEQAGTKIVSAKNVHDLIMQGGNKPSEPLKQEKPPMGFDDLHKLMEYVGEHGSIENPETLQAAMDGIKETTGHLLRQLAGAAGIDWHGKEGTELRADLEAHVKGFTGDITASNGVKYHYVDGKRVAGPQESDSGKPQTAADSWETFTQNAPLKDDIKKELTDLGLTAEQFASDPQHAGDIATMFNKLKKKYPAMSTPDFAAAFNSLKEEGGKPQAAAKTNDELMAQWLDDTAPSKPAAGMSFDDWKENQPASTMSKQDDLPTAPPTLHEDAQPAPVETPAEKLGPIKADADGYKPKAFVAEDAPAVDYANKQPSEIKGWSDMESLPLDKQAYGAVMMRTDPATGKTQVLLRKPTGEYDGYVWTFAKGKRDDANLTPADVAHKEVSEETGYKGEIIGHIPQLFATAGVTQNAIFLMKHDGGSHDPKLMDKETQEVKWVDIDKAHELINQTKKENGKNRDLAILKATKEAIASPPDPKIDELADAAQAFVNDQHAKGDYSGKNLQKGLQKVLGGLHGTALGAVAEKLGTTPKDLATHLNAQLQQLKAYKEFPNDPHAAKYVKALGGSTGAQLVNFNGKQFVKKMGNSPEHIRSENAADGIYAAMGIDVPKSRLYQTPGGPVKLAAFIPGKDLGHYMASATPEQAAAVKKKLQSHFVADALLANYDVVGASSDNIKVDESGKVWRIDNGGSLDFRAQGKKKGTENTTPFGDSVPEIDSMRNANTAPQAAAVFKGITPAEIAKQVKQIVANKDKILAATPSHLKTTMEKRIDWLRENHGKAPGELPTESKNSIYAGAGKDWKSIPPSSTNTLKPPASEHDNPIFKQYEPHETRKIITSSEYAPSFKKHMAAAIAKLTSPEKAAAVSYTGSSYASLNAAMASVPKTLDCLGGPSKSKEKAMSAAIAKAGTMSKPVTVWRNTGLSTSDSVGKNFLAVLQGGLQSGEDVRIPGFKSCAMTPNIHMGGGDIKLEIRAKSGLWVEDISQVGSEQELIQGHNTRYKVVEIHDIKDLPNPKGAHGNSGWGGYHKKLVVLQEV